MEAQNYNYYSQMEDQALLGLPPDDIEIDYQAIFDYLAISYNLNLVSLNNAEKWVHYLTSLAKSASKRLVWALTLPSQSDELRHLTLYTLSYLYQKNRVPMVAYFNIKQDINSYIKKLNWQGFNFLLVDNFLVLEHPQSVGSSKQFYCINNFKHKDLQELLNKRFLDLTHTIKLELLNKN